MAALSSIYATRMLGLFLLLPVLALYGRELPDYSPELLGVAMGAYGLTQALMQIPFGRWSDRLGRKPVITLGLLLFVLGSVIGAMAHSVAMLAAARCVQGAGAVSASVTALVADLTRPDVRTRAMGFIGISIGLSFVVALIVAPVLDAAIGVPGIFMVMCAMGLAGIALLYLAVPAEPTRSGGGEGRSLASMVEILSRGQLRPLYLGIFTLHFIITSTFLAVPQVLKSDLAIPTAAHWKVYLGVFACSILGTVPLILRSERDRGADRLFVGAILLLVGSQLLLGLGHAHLWWVLGVLTLFFAVFNYLEARLPALLTHAAPPADRGAALGVFATAQFIGTFCGGAVGGVLLGRFGLSGVFWGTAAVAFIWAVAAWRAVSRAV